MKKRLINHSLNPYGEMNLNSINSVSHNEGSVNNTDETEANYLRL